MKYQCATSALRVVSTLYGDFTSLATNMFMQTPMGQGVTNYASSVAGTINARMAGNTFEVDAGGAPESVNTVTTARPGSIGGEASSVNSNQLTQPGGPTPEGFLIASKVGQASVAAGKSIGTSIVNDFLTPPSGLGSVGASMIEATSATGLGFMPVMWSGYIAGGALITYDAFPRAYNSYREVYKNVH